MNFNMRIGAFCGTFWRRKIIVESPTRAEVAAAERPSLLYTKLAVKEH